MWTKQDPPTGVWRQSSATTYQSKGQQQYSAAIGANSAYNNRKTDDYYYRDSPSPSTPPRTVRTLPSNTSTGPSHDQLLQVPEIAMVMCRLVEAGLGFTQSTVMSVLAKDDCWNAISFIHALRARETGRKCDMLKSMRTSIDAAMDMVIVDLIVTLINVYKFDRDDVLDAIATFRCHNVEDALNLMEQAQLNREGKLEQYERDLIEEVTGGVHSANASSSASASCVLSTSSTPHGSSIQQHEDSMNPTSTSSTSQLSAAAQEDDTDPALLPYDPALGSYSDYLKARADALKRRDGDKNMIDEGSDAKSLKRIYATSKPSGVPVQILNHALPTHLQVENMTREMILFYLKKHDLLFEDAVTVEDIKTRVLRERLQEHVLMMESCSED